MGTSTAFVFATRRAQVREACRLYREIRGHHGEFVRIGELERPITPWE